MGKAKGRAKGGTGSRVRMLMSGSRGMEGAVGVKVGRRRMSRRGEGGLEFELKAGEFLDGNNGHVRAFFGDVKTILGSNG